MRKFDIGLALVGGTLCLGACCVFGISYVRLAKEEAYIQGHADGQRHANEVLLAGSPTPAAVVSDTNKVIDDIITTVEKINKRMEVNIEIIKRNNQLIDEINAGIEKNNRTIQEITDSIDKLTEKAKLPPPPK